jgi:P27 family predicted phage terminase small subunit
LPESEPKPIPKAPVIPTDLDNGAVEIWQRLAPKLERLGLLTELDGDVFGILCQIRSRLVTIHEFLKSDNQSLVQVTERPSPDGGVFYEYKPSPYVTMEKQYYVLFRQFAKEFGLSPVGRVGLSVGRDRDGGDDLI